MEPRLRASLWETRTWLNPDLTISCSNSAKNWVRSAERTTAWLWASAKATG